MSFRFLRTPYDTGVRISEDGTTVERTGSGKGPPVVFLTQALEVGTELVLQVLCSDVPVVVHAKGLTLGVTTCSPANVQHYSSHGSGVCAPGGPCGGQSVVLPVKQCSEEVCRISIKRVHNYGQIHVVSGKWCGSMSGLSFNKIQKLLPFVLMTGEVSAIRIGSESCRNIRTMSLQSDPPVEPVSVSDYTGFAFMIPGRPDRQEAGKFRTNLRTSMHSVSRRIIFLNRDLSPGSPLVLKVQEDQLDRKAGFSFVFGITTCDRTVFGSESIHRINPNDASTCGDHSKHCKLPPLAVEETVSIERVEYEFVRFTIGSTIYSLDDDNGTFRGKKIFPFVMLCGEVSALEISGTSQSFGLSQIRGLTRDMSSPSVNKDTGFRYSFLVVAEGSSESTVSKIASSNVRGLRFRMTFLNRELAVGQPLFIRVSRVKTEQEISFTFGVTTCDRTSDDNPLEHEFNVEKPSTCKGHQRHCEIPTQPVGSIVSFERMVDRFILIRTEERSYFLTDPNSFFHNKKAFPFVMVNGSAYSLEILNRDEVPPSFLAQSPHNPPSNSNNGCNITISVPNAADVQSHQRQVQVTSASSSPVPMHHTLSVPNNNNKPVAVVQSANSLFDLTSTPRKWYSNLTVSFTGQSMTRTGGQNQCCCIFGELFKPGDGFSFCIQKLDTSRTGSLDFGVTKEALVLVDSENLPAVSNDKWLIHNNMTPVVVCGQEIRVQRNDCEIRVKFGSADPVRLFAIRSEIKVYPFFRFDGSVTELRILS